MLAMKPIPPRIRHLPASPCALAPEWVGPRHPHREEVQAFIASVFHCRYGAQLRHYMPQLLAYRDGHDRLLAAVGLRHADAQPLFLEQYLDAPVQQVLASRLGLRAERGQIVEIGQFAALDAGAARGLIVQLTGLLHAAGIDWVLFVATAQLRNAFARLRLAPMQVCAAQAQRLGAHARDWGSYYQTRPQVMCGNVVEAMARLRASAVVAASTTTSLIVEHS